MKNKFLLTLMLCVWLVPDLWSQKFYDSKSQIIGITGDVHSLTFGGFTQKFFNNENIQLPIEAIQEGHRYDKKKLLDAFRRERTGKKILDLLFQYNGYSLSEELLKDRAMQNVQLMDAERAEIGVIDKNTILREDYLPILQNNYIFLSTTKNIGKSIGQMFLESKGVEWKGDRYRTYWIVFRVKIDEETLNQVFNCWNDMNRYNQIDVPIEYVASGSVKETDAKSGEIRNLLLRSVSKKVEAFAVRGQVLDNHPLTVNIGSDNGIKKGDLFKIYSQRANNKNKFSSVVVSKARAGIVSSGSTRMFAVSGQGSSYKRGDVAVLKMDRGIGHSVTYNFLSMEYDTKYHGVSYSFDKRLHFNKYGISTYLLASAGVILDKTEKVDVKLDHGIEYDDVPTIIDPGIGIGFGKTFFSRVEIMPYAMIHYMFATGEDDDYDDFTEAFRIPVGVKANINIMYPLQLTLGAEYNFMIKEESGSSWEDSDGSVFKGIGLSAGLRVVF